MNKKIVYRVNADGKTGYGHLGRCISLSKFLEGEGYGAVFLLGPDQSGASVAFFRATDSTYQLPENYDEEAEIEAMKQIINLENPSAAVVDLLESSLAMMETIYRSNIPLMAIDDICKNNHMADIIVNAGPVAREDDYKGRRPELLLGSDYLMLRPQFARMAQGRKDNEEPDGIYVSFGGSDPKNYTLRALDMFGTIKNDFSAFIVVGSGYRNYDLLLDRATHSKVKADIRQNEKEPWRIMKWARVAVCSIGSTCWELMLMGVPCITLTQNDNQARYADELAARGVVIHFARNNEFNNDELANTIEKLMGNREMRRGMAEKGRKLVDGKGLERVAKALIRKMKSV
ncbi:hypothetical protein MNBD_NITROSPINAE02-1885 [hydrothermal vent metagenome]|uniref:Glycosyl transferase family 28 C-terminal domain-containing protein n=1 Tax=hydrothermal vent metagenome TaxID=652676 RepID=A0A3B1C3I1_9ZZZZ